MDFEAAKEGNMVEIIFIDNDKKSATAVKGIVLKNTVYAVELLEYSSDTLSIPKDMILSATENVFDATIKEILMETKRTAEQKELLKEEVEKLERVEDELNQRLLDANVLSQFNIVGARNRIKTSIDNDLLKFIKNSFEYEIDFEISVNGELQMRIKVIYNYTYTPISNQNIMNEELLTLAPDVLETIVSCFKLKPKDNKDNFLDKNKITSEKKHYNVKASNFNIMTIYTLPFFLNRDNFMEVRSAIINGLELLKR